MMVSTRTFARNRAVVCGVAVLFSSFAFAAETTPRELLNKSRRVVFLGDSITAAGGYVAGCEAWLLTQKLKSPPVVINAGLPSETVSGLSEDGHAGGKFPRPDLHERLDRVLKLTRPDLIIACYGMNCGIYEPFDEERFARYQQGIQKLRTQAEAIGANIIHVTPPFFDGTRMKKPFSYNAVLDRYSEWLVSQRTKGWVVIDLHQPMTAEAERRRKADPDFTFQPDGVHPNEAGHWFIAQRLIRGFGDETALSAESPRAMLAQKGVPESAYPLIQKRMAVLRDAYVATAGHKRPGVAKGLPVEDAEKAATELTSQIQKMLTE